MAIETEVVTGRRRAGANTAAAEVWLAYLHLLKARGEVRDRAVADELQRLMEAALEAFRRCRPDSSHGPARTLPTK